MICCTCFSGRREQRGVRRGVRKRHWRSCIRAALIVQPRREQTDTAAQHLGRKVLHVVTVRLESNHVHFLLVAVRLAPIVQQRTAGQFNPERVLLSRLKTTIRAVLLVLNMQSGLVPLQSPLSRMLLRAVGGPIERVGARHRTFAEACDPPGLHAGHRLQLLHHRRSSLW